MNLPLISIVNYLGLTLCALSLLPVGPDTLVYGTGDAAVTIFDGSGDNDLLEITENISRYFKFVPHPVRELSTQEIKTLSLAADVEIHLVDGEYYMLDFGRFLPSNNPLSPFTNFFRSEWILNGELEYSPDSFSGFGTIGSEKYNTMSLEAINSLETYISDGFWSVVDVTKISSNNIKRIMHSNGINLRYLGLLRKSSIEKNETAVQEIIVQEIILRSLKTIFQIELALCFQQGSIPVVDIYKDVIVNLYSKVKDPQSDLWAHSLLKDKIIQKFGEDALSESERDDSFSLLNLVSGKKKFYNNVPKYCYFEGGNTNFRTEISMNVKTMFSDIDREVLQIEQAINTNNKKVYWDMRDILYNYVSEQNVFDFLEGFSSVASTSQSVFILKYVNEHIGIFHTNRGYDCLQGLLETFTNVPSETTLTLYLGILVIQCLDFLPGIDQYIYQRIGKYRVADAAMDRAWDGTSVCKLVEISKNEELKRSTVSHTIFDFSHIAILSRFVPTIKSVIIEVPSTAPQQTSTTKDDMDGIANIKGLKKFMQKDYRAGCVDSCFEQFYKLDELEELELYCQFISPLGISYLTPLTNLKSLTIHSPTFSHKCLNYLMENQNLEELKLIESRNFDEKILGCLPPNLLSFHMEPAGALLGDYWNNFPNQCPNLESLTLRNSNQHYDADFGILQSMTNLKNLSLLGFLRMTDGIIEHILPLENLVFLDLSENIALTHQPFAQLSNLENLKTINLRKCLNVETEIQRYLPNVDIFFPQRNPLYTKLNAIFNALGWKDDETELRAVELLKQNNGNEKVVLEILLNDKPAIPPPPPPPPNM